MPPVAKKKSTISVDFSNTESSARNIPEGEYLLTIVDFEQKESSTGNPMIVFTHKVADGPYKGAKVWDNISLTPQALWRFRAMLESLGMKADNKLNLDLASLKGKVFKVQIILEEYQGKTKPRIGEFVPPGGTAPAGQEPSGGKTISKGMKVSFDYEGDQVQGQVVSINGKTVIVAVEVEGATEPEEWEMEVSDLTPVEG